MNETEIKLIKSTIESVLFRMHTRSFEMRVKYIKNSQLHGHTHVMCSFIPYRGDFSMNIYWTAFKIRKEKETKQKWMHNKAKKNRMLREKNVHFFFLFVILTISIHGWTSPVNHIVKTFDQQYKN